jgi:hypothetical protein
MEVPSVQFVSCAVWGFLAGLVGWVSCFRAPEPMSGWLLEYQGKVTAAVGIVRMLLTIFLLFAVLMVLCAPPMFFTGGPRASPDEWRTLLGASFWGSMAGMFFLLFLQRFSSRKKR